MSRLIKRREFDEGFAKGNRVIPRYRILKFARKSRLSVFSFVSIVSFVVERTCARYIIERSWFAPLSGVLHSASGGRGHVTVGAYMRRESFRSSFGAPPAANNTHLHIYAQPLRRTVCASNFERRILAASAHVLFIWLHYVRISRLSVSRACPQKPPFNLTSWKIQIPTVHASEYICMIILVII